MASKQTSLARFTTNDYGRLIEALLSGEKSGKPIDPYFIWALLTKFRQFIRKDDAEKPILFSVLVETNDIDALRRIPGLSVPDCYVPGPNGSKLSFATVRFALDPARFESGLALLVKLIASCVRVQLGFPRGLASQPLVFDSDASFSPKHRELANRIPASDGVMIGVIDDGAAFAHDSLRVESGDSRVISVWNQSTMVDYAIEWNKKTKFGYGATLGSAAINALIYRWHRPDGEVDSFVGYQSLAKKKPTRNLLGRESHGATVTTIAAGSLGSLGIAESDTASKANIVFVELPKEQAEISSGRWFAVNGLDALHHCINERNKVNSSMPLVVNVSTGSCAGPHDGSAMFERALDQILAADDRIAIVLAAGNSRLAKAHWSSSIGDKTTNTIVLRVPALKKFETMVEVWFDCEDAAAMNKLSIILSDPVGKNSIQVREHGFAQLTDGTSEPIASVVFLPSVVQTNTKRRMALICISATSVSADYPYAPSGDWKITVSNPSTKRISVDAWIERDEVVFGARRQQSATFVEATDFEPLPPYEPLPPAAKLRRSGTFSNIANGQKTISVSATTGDAKDGFVSTYSSEPYRGRFATFSATADQNAARLGILVRANYRSALRHMNGTSVAAPQATRWLANAMAAGQTRTQILEQIAQKPSRKHPQLGKVHPSEGREVLDYVPPYLAITRDDHK